MELHLQIYFTAPSSSTANGTAAAANGNASKQQQQQQPVPPAAAVQAAVQQLQSQLFSNLQQLVFVPDHIDAAASSSNSSSTAKQQSQAQKLSLIKHNSSGTVGDISSSSIGDPCISLKLLQHTSSSGSPAPAPMFEYTPAASKQQQLLTLPLSLDVLCYAPSSSSSLSDLHGLLLVPALQQQLQRVGVQLQQQASSGQALCPVKAMHFRPPVLGFPVSVCYAVPIGA